MYRVMVTAAGATPERVLSEIRHSLQILETGLASCDAYPIAEYLSIGESEHVHTYARYCPDAPTTAA